MKLKTILIGIAILFVASAFVTANILIKENRNLKTEIQRTQNNNFQLMQEGLKYSSLLVKEREVTGKLRKERDEIAEKLKIKPKFIDKIVYVTTTETDTVIKEVPVTVVSKDFWHVSDTGKCFTWDADIKLLNDILHVNRTGYANTDSVSMTYYRKRLNKFLWFSVGKRVNYVQVDSKCGDSKVQEFTFQR